MIITKAVKIKWNGNNKKHFISKGHEFTKFNDEFEVNIYDLTDTTNATVEIICDSCGKQETKNYRKIKNKEINFCSKECANLYRRGKGTPRVQRFEVNCDYCGQQIQKTDVAMKGHKNVFCNHKCASAFKKGKSNEKLKKREPVNCYICNEEFELPPYRIEGSQRHFCSKECQVTWQSSKEYSDILFRGGTIQVNCDHCGEAYTQKRTVAEKNKHNFCSLECKNSAKHLWMILENPNPKKQKVIVNCFHCGREKPIHQSKHKTNKYHFCSKECYWEWRTYTLTGENSPTYKRVTKPCDQCGDEIKVIPFEIKEDKNNFCSQECYWNFRSKHYVGENHPLFGTKLSVERVNKMRIGLVNRFENGELPRNTSIQKIINSVLDDLEIKYTNEYNCKYYSVDNFLTEYELMIEVMGDYWHTNPIKYLDLNNITKQQKDGIRRDKAKNTYIKKYKKINVLYLWETDIKKRANVCVELIINYIENQGILSEYNSFNYTISQDGNIQLNDNIINPYFMLKVK